MKPQNAARLAVCALAAALTAACAHRQVRQPSAAAPVQTPAASTASQQEPSVREAALIEVPQLKKVYFAYDSDRLTPDAEKTLSANSAWLKSHVDIKIQVAGNCDQRGTVEYNLALGQRRAAAVRRYYGLMGVPGSRVATISYGKERPVCSQETEACWQKNRRADTLEAVSQNVSSSAAPPSAR